MSPFLRGLRRRGALEPGHPRVRPAAAGATLGLGAEGRLRHWGYAQLRASF